MISKKLHSLLILFLLVISSPNLKAQNLELINTSLQLLNSVNSNCNCDCIHTLDINHPFFEGKITLKDSTVLVGKISVNQYYQNRLITIFNNNDQYEPIDNEIIKDVNLRHDENQITKETKFQNISEDNRLYRLVHQKDSSISVYDSSDNPQENSLVGKVYVKENNSITDTWNFWTSGPKKDLINYLNDRDGTNYKRRDFKALDDLFAML
ncbi:hypothetical protein [Winogradskyella sp.]|uniref:hypothetical protein n=1 Tax=Winogradskyella sp. TaxID=1883156 RepID=UPI003AB761D5